MVCLHFSPIKGRGPCIDHLFFVKGSETSYAYKAPASASPFFPTKGNEMPSKKCNIFNKSAGHHIFYEWPLNAPLHKKLSLWSFRRKYCTTKDSAQTYDFIADKRCLLFSIILKVLSGWDSYQNTGKMCKIIYKNFCKDFVIEQNLTRPKGDFWSFFNRPY